MLPGLQRNSRFVPALVPALLILSLGTANAQAQNQPETASEDLLIVETEKEEQVVPWAEIFDEFQAGIALLEPRVEELDQRQEPPTKREASELTKEFETLNPVWRKLDNRKDEASEKEVEELAQSKQILDRLAALVEQERKFAAPEEQRNAPLIETMLNRFKFYGSLRVRAFIDDDGNTEVDDATSRWGIRGDLNISQASDFFGRLEMGTNILTEASRILGGDPGGREGEETDALPLRLLFVGFEGPWGRSTFGKQWSVFYDVGVFTDQGPFFSGEAAGVYAGGTDGGVSGTGRADMALQYRFAWREIKFGLQAQIRDETENDRTFADTYGGSAVFQSKMGIGFGAAYNTVRDGVPEPQEGQAKLGDEIAIFGARWQNRRWYLAGTYSTFKQHEKDDLDRFFDGDGYEFYADYEFTERFATGLIWNYQTPVNEHPGDYSIHFIALGASYQLPKWWRFYALYKLEDSAASDGTPLRGNSLGLSVFFSF